jgi:hypothetical protein
MTIKHYDVNDAQPDAQSDETCSNPNAEGRLAEYLADPVNYAEAKEVEEHLLECLNCREFILAVLDIRGEARMVMQAGAGADGSHPPGDAKVKRLAGFKGGRR